MLQIHQVLICFGKCRGKFIQVCEIWRPKRGIIGQKSCQLPAMMSPQEMNHFLTLYLPLGPLGDVTKLA